MSTAHVTNPTADDSAKSQPKANEPRHRHARAVRSCAIWYFLVGVAGCVLGVFGCLAEDFVLSAVVLGVAGLHFATGWGLIKLKRWARIPTAVISGIGLIGFPIGTVIHGYILYTVFSAAGQRVFAGDDRSILIRQRPSLMFWIGVTILIALLGFVFIQGAMMS